MAAMASPYDLNYAAPTLPGNLTQEQAREAYNRFKQMKSQRVPENDPEFIKTRNLVYAIQRHVEASRLNQSHAQNLASPMQKLPRPLPPAMNGHSVANSPPYRGNILPPNVLDQAIDGHVPERSDRHDASLAQPAKPGPASTLSDDQLGTLRMQMMAFKMLQANNPMPLSMQQQLFKSQQSHRPPSLQQGLAAAEEVLQEASGKLADNVKQDDNDVRHTFHTACSPHSYLQENISHANHAVRRNRYHVPSLLPVGVQLDRCRRDRQRNITARMMDRKMQLHTRDGLNEVDQERLQEERDRIAYYRIMSRKSELEKLPANLSAWDSGRSERASEWDDDTLKRKALIEYKMLCLLPKQRALRQQVRQDLITYNNLAQTANRALYRRQKKTTLREARITEKLEKAQRDQREDKERQKQIAHLRAIINHGHELRQAADAQRQRQQKLGRLMLAQHQVIEKEEQRRIERTAKQRLQALKNDDEETYLKLLGQAKDSRISHLLKQTDGFLGQLAASVKQQQKGADEQYARDLPEPASDASDDEEGEDGPKVDYYQVAHRVKEEITQQPSLLVGGTLKEYQLKGLQWMISLFNNNLNGILADEMGLGKTIQTISLLTHLKEFKADRGGAGPFLVIVPLSTLTNWNVEFEKWAPSLRRIVYKGPPNTRKAQQQQIRYGQFDVLLTTYEYIIKDRPVLARIKWVHMIVDEGHRMKNAGSKLSMTLTSYYSTRYRLILTGTPLQNNLPELWALLNFVLPTIFKSVKSFDEWFNTPFANTGGQDKMELTEEEQLLVIRRLHKVLRPFLLRRLKKDVEKDLPDKQERVIKCQFSALQAKIYKQLVTYNKISVSDGKGGKTGIRGLSNMLMQLRKLCNHPFVFEQVEDQMNPDKLSNDLLWRTAGKFELLDRILPKFKATGHRVLMFFQMTQIMNIMEDFLRLRGLQYLRLDGATKSDERTEMLGLFNAPDSPYFCFLLSTRAGGLGLNLQTADTVIIYDSDWNPHQDLQAQDRAHRIGQKNEVRILRLISSGSVEEKILERAQYKLDMDGKVIQAGRFDNKSTNEERDAMLRTLLDTAEAADDVVNQEEIMDDDDLNEIMARSEDELAVFQAIDAERAKDETYGEGPGKMPRLLAENELPEVYMQEDNPVTEEIEEITGRGARERTRVKYDDGLTEEQWLMAVDDDEDTIEDAIARKNATMEKRNATREKNMLKSGANTATATTTTTADGTPEPSRDPSPGPSSARKSRNRKSTGPGGNGNGAGKRKAEEPAVTESNDATTEDPASRKKQKPSKPADTLSPKFRASLQKILNANFQALMDLEEEIEEGQSRGLIDIFLKPVPKNVYPDYYVIIKNPICMEQVEKKINKKEYQNLREYRDDIVLLCDNARTYNDDSSGLYQDANAIEAEMNRKLAEDTSKSPDWKNWEDERMNAADQAASLSTSKVSNADNNSGNPKLKLKFGAKGAPAKSASQRGSKKDDGAGQDEEDDHQAESTRAEDDE